MEKISEATNGDIKNTDEKSEIEVEAIGKLDSKKSLLDEKKEKVFIPKTNSWIISSFISCLLFACSNLFLSMYSENWAQTRELAYVGIFIYSITYFIITYLLSENGKFFDLKSSMFYDRTKSKVNFKVIFGVIISTFFQVITGYTTIVAMEFSECAGINKGVITTLFAFNSVLMSVYAWWMLNEKISGFHVFGLGSIVTCISLLGFNDTTNSRAYHLEESFFFEMNESCSSIYAIGFGLL